MKEIYLDTETIDLPKNRAGDLMCQLAYIVYDTETKKFQNHFNGFYLPDGYKEMAVMAMTRTKLTPEALEQLVNNLPFDEIKELVSDTENILFIHNAEFDLEILKRAGIEVKCKVVCTLRVVNLINDQLQLPYESTSLEYMHYYLRNYKRILELLQSFNETVPLNQAHDALYDCLCLYLLVQRIRTEFKLTNETAIKITNHPIKYKYCSFGKNRGMQWSDMSYNQLKYFYDLGDKDIQYTIDLIRG